MCADRPVAALVSAIPGDSLFWAVKAPWAGRGRLSLSHVGMRSVGDAFGMNHLGRKIVSQRECTQRKAT